MPELPTIVICLDKPRELPPPNSSGFYDSVRCGRLQFDLTATQKRGTVHVRLPDGDTTVVSLPPEELGAFLELSAKHAHAEAWEELIQYLRNDCGVADQIDPHTELWDGLDGHQPSSPGAVIPRPRGRRGLECVHLFTVG